MNSELKKQLHDLKSWLGGESLTEIPVSIKTAAKRRIEESFKVKKNNLEKLISTKSGLGRAYDVLSDAEREKFMMSPIVAYNLMYNWTRKDLFEINSWLHLYLTWLGKTKNTVHYSGGDFLGEKFYRQGKAFYSSPISHGIVIDLKSANPGYKEEEEKVIVQKITDSLNFMKEHFTPYFELVTLMIQTIQISRPQKNHQYDMRSHYQTPGTVFLLNPYLGLEKEELAYGLVTQAFRIMLYYIEMCSPFTSDNDKMRETWTLCPWTNRMISGYALLHECLIRFGLINFLDVVTEYSDCEWAKMKLDETRNGFLFNRYLLVGILNVEDKIDQDVVTLIRELHRIVLASEWKKNPAPLGSGDSSLSLS
jgi:hypothetical protein